MATVGIIPEEQRMLARKMQVSTNYYMQKLDEMKENMVRMGNFWQDTQYESFMSTFEAELSKLQSLQETLNERFKEINRAADEGDAMINSIQRLVE